MSRQLKPLREEREGEDYIRDGNDGVQKAFLSAPARNPTAASRASFPRSKDEFEGDDRVAYSKADQKWILEDELGETWEWHDDRQVWGLVVVFDEDDILRQQQAYAVEGEAEEIDNPRERRKEAKKRRQTGDPASEEQSTKRVRPDGPNVETSTKPRPGQKQRPKREPTAIYITGLPSDTTIADLEEVFQKYGFIATSTDTGAPRIKLYGGADGDGLVIYAFPASVKLAIQMMDEAPFEPSSLSPGKPGAVIRVREAEDRFKRVQSEGQTENKVRKQLSDQQKQRIEAQKRKIASKLADWSGDEGDKPAEQVRRSNFVVLKHMFTLDELDQDPAARFEIKQDIWDECAKLGRVTNLVLYDAEPAGIVKVRFGEPGGADAADACVKAMHGRAFGGQSVEAVLWDGRSRFQKTGKEDDDDQEGGRLDRFGEWLEGTAD